MAEGAGAPPDAGPDRAVRPYVVADRCVGRGQSRPDRF